MTARKRPSPDTPVREATITDRVAWAICRTANPGGPCECEKRRNRGSCQGLKTPAINVVNLVREHYQPTPADEF